MAWTEKRIASLQIDPEKNRQEVLIEKAPTQGGGALVLRLESDGKSWWWRGSVASKKVLLSLGAHDRDGCASWWVDSERTEHNRGRPLTLAAASEGFVWIRSMRPRDPRDVLAEFEERRLARRAAAAAEAATGSLKALAEFYLAGLRARGAVSAESVANLFQNHLYPHAELCERPAKSISSADLASVLRRMRQRGIGRACNVLRASLAAAFNRAAGAENDPDADPGEFEFGVTANPALAVRIVQGVNVALDRTLAPWELRLYLEEADRVESDVLKHFLRLHVFLAGQRVQQMLRARWPDFDDEAGTLLLWDQKGRGGIEARPHLLPVIGPALEELESLYELTGGLRCKLLFTTDGETQVAPSTVNGAARDVVTRVQARGLELGLEVEDFSPRDVRRTAETALASLGVPREHRAHLLSHGRESGVQSRHYDRHSYASEKVSAMQAWHRHLAACLKAEPPSKAKVSRLRRKAA